jgi:hypothetical protein
MYRWEDTTKSEEHYPTFWADLLLVLGLAVVICLFVIGRL